LSVQQGIIFRNDAIVVPSSLRRMMIKKVHLSHNGVESTLKLAKDNFFWPSMTAQITEYVRKCEVCLKYADNQQKLDMITHQIPDAPWQIVSSDICFVKDKGKSLNLLVTVDHYSDFIEVDILSDLTGQAVVRALSSQWSRYESPEELMTDNGTHYINNTMEIFSKTWNFKHTTSALHYPRSNGKAESAVKIIKNLFRKSLEANENFWMALNHWSNQIKSNFINSLKLHLQTHTLYDKFTRDLARAIATIIYHYNKFFLRSSSIVFDYLLTVEFTIQFFHIFFN
jgi:hypothetical protein